MRPLLFTLALFTLIGLAPALAAPGPTAALLYRTDAGLATANELIDASALAYPGVACTAIHIDLAADPTAAQLYAAVDAKINRLEYTYLQLMPDVSPVTHWPNRYRGSSCNVLGTDYWATATLLMREWNAASSPPGNTATPGYCWFADRTEHPMQRVAHLTGTANQCRAKIALACAAPVAGMGAVLDGPGKSGPANNANRWAPIQTYWEVQWGIGQLAGMKTRTGGYYPIFNDMTGYRAPDRDKTDTIGDLPGGAKVNQTEPVGFPVGYLLVHGPHQNGDSKFGPAWPGLAAYANIGLAPRSVVVNTFSYSAKGANLNDWYSIPAAAYVGNVEEPCLVMPLRNEWACNAYLRDNLTLSDMHAMSAQFTGDVGGCFGVAWMRAR